MATEESTPYRQVALDRLSSPEQLDQVLQVTHLRSWLALGALGVILLIAVVWSIVGSIPTKVVAQGMLITPGGLFELYAPDDGRVVEVLVREGQKVEKGQPVARLDQADLERQADDLKMQVELLGAPGAPGGTNRVRELREAERTLATLMQRLEDESAIRSPQTGRVLEIKMRSGDIVSRGAPLVSLQLADGQATGLQAVVYVPAARGKAITPGMDVQISPTIAAREEYGFLLGKVTYVSEFPATREGMMRVLANQGLVENLSAAGAPYAVWADLQPDATSKSGYQWSSPKGSQILVNSGTLCDVFITVREQRPIELVLPLLRRASGL